MENNKLDEKLIYLESILLISDKPLKIKNLTKKLEISDKQFSELLKKIEEKFNIPQSGIHLISSKSAIQFTTNPASAEIISEFIKDELNAKLSNASLETLTIIAYRGPITKSELEQIRGVNCSLILKNLLMRNLIESITDKEKISESYNISLEFLKYLGINKVEDLPDYEKLHSNQIIDKILEEENQI